MHVLVFMLYEWYFFRKKRAIFGAMNTEHEHEHEKKNTPLCRTAARDTICDFTARA